MEDMAGLVAHPYLPELGVGMGPGLRSAQARAAVKGPPDY